MQWPFSFEQTTTWRESITLVLEQTTFLVRLSYGRCIKSAVLTFVDENDNLFYGCDNPQELTPEVLNKNNVVKAQMAEWLFTSIYMLNKCCLLLMSSARTTTEKLQEEKICDQWTVIELQEKLLSKQDIDLGHISQTVEKELKSYSSVLQQSCSSALTPTNIATVVQKII